MESSESIILDNNIDEIPVPLATSLTPEQRFEVHESINYEAIISSDLIRKDKLSQILLFPQDNLSVVSLDKVNKHTTPTISDEMVSEVTGTPVEECIQVLKKSYTVVQKKYSNKGGKVKHLLIKNKPSYPDSEWPEKPINDPEKESKLFLSIPILRNYQDSDDIKDKQDRQNCNRVNIFQVYDVPRPENELPTDYRISNPPTATIRQSLKLLVNCSKLQFQTGNFEPFFCSATLYDVNKKVRVSETWYFDVNDDNALSLLGGRIVKDPITCSANALFTISQPNPDIQMVIKVEKVIRGVELESVQEPYFKGNTLKPKEKEKLQKECETTIIRLGDFKQVFAWGCIPIFSDNSQLAVGEGISVKLMKFRADDTEATILDNIKRKKLEKKFFPADFILNFKPVDHQAKLNNLVDSSYRPVDVINTNEPVIKEILEFRDSSDDLDLYFEYINNLYIYPESVNLTKHKDSNNKNIAVRVRFKNNDDDPAGDGIPALYGRSSVPQFINENIAQLTYHKKNPNFLDEIKIRLPTKLNDTNHIMFLFTHVFCQPKGSKGSTIDHPLGLAAIPIYVDQKIIEDQRFTVAVAHTAVPSYLSPDAEANIKWVDNKRPLFTFRTKLVSTIYTQDDNLNEFLKQYFAGGENKQLTMAIRKLPNVEQHVYAHYFPVVLNLLLNVMCNRPESVAKEAFIAMFVVLTNVAGLPGQSSRGVHLPAYVDYIFANSPANEKFAYQVLTKLWNVFHETKHPDLSKSFQFSWFIYDIIVKSMTLHLHRENSLNADKVRSLFFHDELLNDLRHLIKYTTSSVIELKGSNPLLSKYTALFLKDLFDVMDRGFVFNLVSHFISRLDPKNAIPALVSEKFEAIRTIYDYEHFIQLNLPTVVEMSSVTTLMVDFWKRHFLVGLLLDEVASCLLSTTSQNRMKSLLVLRDLMWKYDTTPEYDDPVCRQRIAGMFFPFILIALERYEVAHQSPHEEKKEWFVCLLYIIKNCDRRSLLRKWWLSDTQKNHVAFLNLLHMGIKVLDDPSLLREASFITLDVLEEFMEDMTLELLAENSRLMDAFFGAVVQLLKKKQTVSFLSCLFMSIRRFILKFKDVIFLYKNTSYCSDLCLEILRYTNSVNAITRSEAGSIFYLLIKINYLLRGNFARTKLQATIAVSKLCGEVGIKDFSQLKKTLEYVAKLAKKEFNSVSLGDDVEDLTKRLFKVISDSIKISEHHFDPEMTADLTYQVSIGYTASPDLRVTWLENLVKFHKDQKNFEEAAQCKFCIAALIIDFLNLSGPLPGIPGSSKELSIISPNISKEPGLPSKEGDEGLFNSSIFSEEGLVETLAQAVKFLKVSQRYETCIDVYNILLEIHQSHRDYHKLSFCFRDLKIVCDALVASNQARSRLFSIFYRVGFYGSAFGELNGKELIYKEPAHVRLAEFSQRLQQQFAAYGSQPKVLPNTPIDASKLDPTQLHLQIASVEPYFAEDDTTNRKTEWDRNFNIQYFIFETPFTLDGKPHGDLSVQCKRKTIVEVENSFPYSKKRLAVVGKKEIILEPIENAIEIIHSKEKALRRELDLSPPNIKTLQINLQGAVLAMVNSGPVEIAKTFLGSNASNYPVKHVELLSKMLHEFMNVCGFALKLNKTLIGPEQLDFQTECENGYARLKSEINALMASSQASLNSPAR